MNFSEKNIFIQETEIKPNGYATIVLLVTLLSTVICWILNELGIFRVGALEMRIGSVFSLIIIAVPLLILRLDKKAASDNRMKYCIMTAAGFYTLNITTLLSFHTTILLLLPIFIAMLYRSRSLGVLALTFSLLCAALSPILGYVLGSWDVDFLRELIFIATNGTVAVVGATSVVSASAIGEILLYIVVPRSLLVGCCSLLMFYVISIGEDYVSNQMLIHRLSRIDILTGLYNQNTYKEFQRDKVFSGQLGIIFFDVNGLKAANDSYGHEYGDLLLKRCAESILEHCSDTDIGFRIGGDEFLMIMENAGEVEVSAMLNQWETSLDRINRENIRKYDGIVCSMATGYTTGDADDLENLIHKADAEMYHNKIRMRECNA